MADGESGKTVTAGFLCEGASTLNGAELEADPRSLYGKRADQI